jgi:hypothetical protein|tara:strand:- start:880 stop:1077 length:198 start_codon:yes stop_codon:yes gene_type:complete
MTFDEIDEETTVSEKEAVHELKKHSINFSVLFGGDLYCIDSSDTICLQDENGEYNAQTILNWLGH